MQSITADILITILNVLPMPDKRHLVMCNRRNSQLQHLLIKYQTKFLADIGFHVTSKQTISNQYMLECMYYDYSELITVDYFNNHNKRVYLNASFNFIIGKNNCTNIIKKFAPTYLTRTDNIANGLAVGGHLELLKWFHAQKCDLPVSIIDYARDNSQTEVLDWATKTVLSKKVYYVTGIVGSIVDGSNQSIDPCKFDHPSTDNDTVTTDSCACCLF